MLRKIAFIKPMAPTLAKTPPSGDEWLHEMFDGFRVKLHVEGGNLAIYGRTGADMTKRFHRLKDALSSWGPGPNPKRRPGPFCLVGIARSLKIVNAFWCCPAMSVHLQQRSAHAEPRSADTLTTELTFILASTPLPYCRSEGRIYIDLMGLRENPLLRAERLRGTLRGRLPSNRRC